MLWLFNTRWLWCRNIARDNVLAISGQFWCGIVFMLHSRSISCCCTGTVRQASSFGWSIRINADAPCQLGCVAQRTATTASTSDRSSRRICRCSGCRATSRHVKRLIWMKTRWFRWRGLRCTCVSLRPALFYLRRWGWYGALVRNGMHQQPPEMANIYRLLM